MSKVNDFMKELDVGPSVSKEVNTKQGQKLAYVRIPGVISLSHSRRQAMYSCPRRFQLREILNQPRQEFKNTDLAFGSAFGAGLQELLRTKDLGRSYTAALANWDYPAWDEISGKPKRGKHFGECLHTLRIFHDYHLQNFSDEWELAYINGKPGIELTFYIRVLDDYDYQGHIDLIMRHKPTGALAVVEIKTSGMAQQEAMWGNSDQALGYYVVLDHLQKELGIEALPRIVYFTLEVAKWDTPEENHGFKVFPYEKSEATKIEFINNLLIDVNIINLYLESGHFPKRGSACVAFNRVCEFYGSCDMESMQEPELFGHNEEFETMSLDEVDFVLDIRDIVNRIAHGDLA